VYVYQTLAKVVEGWRKHEQEKSEGVKRLQQEKELAERRHTKQQEVAQTQYLCAYKDLTCCCLASIALFEFDSAYISTPPSHIFIPNQVARLSLAVVIT
jgi:hypothetical protein